VSAVPTGQTLVADPGPLVSSERGRFEVARPFPTRAQPAPPEPGARTHLEPPDNATRPVARRTRATKLVIDSPFAAVPEWVIDAQISDTALRLYCVLLRYGNTTGHRMPSRATLAARLHKKSTDTIDRALRELEHFGALTVEHRATGTGRALTNRYHLLTTRPGGNPAESAVRRRSSPTAAAPAEDRDASPPAATRSPGDSDGRTHAAPPAAPVRPGWPHRSGRTESHSPRHHPTPPPPPRLSGRHRSTSTRPTVARPTATRTRRPIFSPRAGSPTSAPSSASSTTTDAASPAPSPRGAAAKCSPHSTPPSPTTAGPPPTPPQHCSRSPPTAPPPAPCASPHPAPGGTSRRHRLRLPNQCDRSHGRSRSWSPAALSLSAPR